MVIEVQKNWRDTELTLLPSLSRQQVEISLPCLNRTASQLEHAEFFNRLEFREAGCTSAVFAANSAAVLNKLFQQFQLMSHLLQAVYAAIEV
jgi:hypothetical protein